VNSEELCNQIWMNRDVYEVVLVLTSPIK